MSDQVLAFVDWLNRSAELWWQCFAAASWQAGLVALLGIALIQLKRHWSAPVRYGILLVCLLKFALAPVLLIPSRTNDLLTIEFSRPEATAFHVESASVSRPSPPPPCPARPSPPRPSKGRGGGNPLGFCVSIGSLSSGGPPGRFSPRGRGLPSGRNGPGRICPGPRLPGPRLPGPSLPGPNRPGPN